MRRRSVRARFVLPATIMVAALGVPSGGQAAVAFAGTCLINMHASISPAMSLTSTGALSVSISGGGTCVVSADTVNPIELMTFSGSGTALIATCESFHFGGLYGLNFLTPPGPPSSNGSFVLDGSVSGVALTMIGTVPLFVGEGTLAGVTVGAPLACAGSGVTDLDYLGVLTFSDP